ncbi:hypothetical protein [Hyalangium minutum]|uniref:Uncharacterized protein n=1 Tax=Hyalangium minutum TaxID=394096 RepID=A0A085WFV6_9BACT|nr:hypothetical protein [Hyalangium minutum]KFE66569.1 hypothetical protein DB31_1042 [Hyalangium minutum]
MSGEEELFRSGAWMYRLLRAADGTLILEVVVGTIAMYEVRVRLNEDEAAAYAREGTAFTDRMAQDIIANPRFHGRAER